MAIRLFGNYTSPVRRWCYFRSTALEGHRTALVTGETPVTLAFPSAEGCATTPDFLDFGTFSREGGTRRVHASVCQYTI